MEPVVNGGVNVPTNVQQLNTNKKAKVAFKQDLQMQPELQQDQFSTMPVVYNPELAEKKKSSPNILGLTALGVTTALIGGLIGKKMGAKGLKEAQALADDATKKIEAAVKDKENVQKALDKERTLSLVQRFKRLFNPTAGMTKEEISAREAAMKAKEELAQAAKKAKKDAKAAETVKETVKNTVDEAAEAADSMVH